MFPLYHDYRVGDPPKIGTDYGPHLGYDMKDFF